MRRLKQQENADSTWQTPPVRQWRIKFFASLCLLAFMTGLMLGKVFKPDPASPGRLLHVSERKDGVRLCFSRLPQVSETGGQGAYVLRLAKVTGEELGGSLQLPDGRPVSWRLVTQGDGLQLGLVSVQPLKGSWHPLSGRNGNCLEVQVGPVQSATTDTAAQPAVP